MDSGQGSAQTKQAKKSKKWPKVLLALVLVASLAGNGYLVFEKLNAKSEEKSKVGTVCGDDIVDKYNKLYADSTTNNDKYSSLLKEIESKENYKEDVNCVYLGYIISASIANDASTYVNLLEANVNKNINPSLNIESVKSITQIKQDANFYRDPSTIGGYSD